MFFTFVSLIYYGYFDHRQWVNERLAAAYAAVEASQAEVLQTAVEVLPSTSNSDTPPNAVQITLLRSKLLELSAAISQLDDISPDIAEASVRYRGSVSTLVGALSRYDPEIPETQALLTLALDRWDVSALQFAQTVEPRISKFRKTLVPAG